MLTLQLLDCHFSVHPTDSPELHAELAQRFIRVPSRTEATFEATYRFDTVGEFLRLEINGREVGQGRDMRSMVDLLAWSINQQVAANSAKFMLFHGGAVSVAGVGLALPGRSGSGKSTLTAALLRNGWRFHSDEVIAIDAQGLIHTYGLPLNLKRRSWPLFPAVQITAELEAKASGQLLVDPSDLGSAYAAEPVHLTRIVLPRFGDRTDTALTELTRAQGFFSMLDNCLNSERLEARRFHALARLVEDTAVYELPYRDVRAAARLVSRSPDR